MGAGVVHVIVLIPEVRLALDGIVDFGNAGKVLEFPADVLHKRCIGHLLEPLLRDDEICLRNVVDGFPRKELHRRGLEVRRVVRRISHAKEAERIGFPAHAGLCDMPRLDVIVQVADADLPEIVLPDGNLRGRESQDLLHGMEPLLGKETPIDRCHKDSSFVFPSIIRGKEPFFL